MRTALDVVLKVTIIIGFLYTVNLIGSLPDLTVSVETLRLIDETQVESAGGKAAEAAASAYNSLLLPGKHSVGALGTNIHSLAANRTAIG
ncbi:MAG TPA: hypothetical protein VE569_12315 [Acidimicrobiia bacterium]|nr:hypothetical protein [Acidimicrobiia bacterium]